MKGSFLIWMYIGIAAIISVIPIFFLIRRYKNPGLYKNPDSAFREKNDLGPPFALTELSDMLKHGLITKEEFDKLKKSVIDDFSKFGENGSKSKRL
jgi:hypothetical protein